MLRCRFLLSDNDDRSLRCLNMNVGTSADPISCLQSHGVPKQSDSSLARLPTTSVPAVDVRSRTVAAVCTFTFYIVLTAPMLDSLPSYYSRCFARVVDGACSVASFACESMDWGSCECSVFHCSSILLIGCPLPLGFGVVRIDRCGLEVLASLIIITSPEYAVNLLTALECACPIVPTVMKSTLHSTRNPSLRVPS